LTKEIGHLVSSSFSNGMVAAGHPLEVEAGLDILQLGGNAVDAAITAAFVADLAEPAMCGLGAHGVMSVYWAETGKTTVIDFYDVAPATASTSMFRTALGKSSPEKTGALGYPSVENDEQFFGHRSVMVPSQVAGLCSAFKLFASLPLTKLMGPAINLASKGVPVDKIMARYIQDTKHMWNRYPEMESTFGKNIGDFVVRSDLAKTLELIANEGEDVFYRGAVAELIVQDMCDNGGILSAEDLDRYRPLVYESDQYTYRDFSYVTGGNVTLVEALNILENFDISPSGHQTLETVHLMIESMKLSWADTLAHVGDPRGSDSPWKSLISKEYARERASIIDPDKVSSFPNFGNPWMFENKDDPGLNKIPIDDSGKISGHTTKVVVMDRDNNVVSLITSLGTYFGSQIIVPGTGILLNNSMHRLDPRPGYINSIMPGKGMQRLTSSVITFNNNVPVSALAGSLSIFLGGMGIHPFVNMVDFGMGIHEAINSLRFHPAGEEIWVDSRMDIDLLEGLTNMGHKLVLKESSYGNTSFGNHVGLSFTKDKSLMSGGIDVLHNNGLKGF